MSSVTTFIMHACQVQVTELRMSNFGHGVAKHMQHAKMLFQWVERKSLTARHINPCACFLSPVDALPHLLTVLWYVVS